MKTESEADARRRLEAVRQAMARFGPVDGDGVISCCALVGGLMDGIKALATARYAPPPEASATESTR